MSEVGKLLIETITDSDPAIRDRSVRELVARVELSPRSSRRVRELEQFRRAASKPVRAGPRLALSPCPLPLRDPGRPGDPRIGPDPVRRLHGPDGASLRTGDRDLSRDDEARRAQRRDLQRAGPGLRADRLSDPGRPGAALGPELPGQSLDVPGRRRRRAPAADPSAAARARVGRRPLPHSGRADSGAAGPVAQRLVRHFLPRHGLSRRGAGAEYLGRPGRAWPRSRRPVRRSRPAAGDHRADPPPDQHRPERLQGRRQPGGAVQLRQRLPGPGQGGGRRLGSDPPCPGGNAHAARRPAGAGRAEPATGWRSSARSTTSPRGRGWPSRPTCWPR